MSGTAAGAGAARESPGNWGPRVLRARRGIPCRALRVGSISVGTSTPLALHLAARSLVGTIVRSWVLGGGFGEDLGIWLGKPRRGSLARFLPRPPAPHPLPKHTPYSCWNQAMNEKFVLPTCCLRGEILSGVPLMFGGALQFQVSTAEYWVFRKVQEDGGWEMKQCSNQWMNLKLIGGKLGVSQWGWDAARTGGRSLIPDCLASSLPLRTSPTCRQ